MLSDTENLKLSKIISVTQWLPSHRGIQGNDVANKITSRIQNLSLLITIDRKINLFKNTAKNITDHQVSKHMDEAWILTCMRI